MVPPGCGGAAPRGRAAPVFLLLMLAPAGAACGGAAARSAAAVEVFEQFQDCLFRGDRQVLRPLLSRESRAFVDDLPLERAHGKLRLAVVRTRSEPPSVLVVVRDPNEDDRERTFVLVREDGRLVVDLLATTAYNHRVEHDPAGGLRLEPRPLTPAELAKIRSLPGEAPFR